LNAVEAKGLAVLFPGVASLKLDAALRDFENGELLCGGLRWGGRRSRARLLRQGERSE
jgi:hypothetical protein